MSYLAKKNRQSMAFALLFAMLASLLPIHEGYAEVADHGAPAVAASAALVQSSQCQQTTCVTTPSVFGFMCEACECIWVWVDDNGNSRMGRDHWIRCGVQ